MGLLRSSQMLMSGRSGPEIPNNVTADLSSVLLLRRALTSPECVRTPVPVPRVSTAGRSVSLYLWPRSCRINVTYLLETL